MPGTHRQVVVAGAGPAGSAAAYFLARSGADVLLLDRSEFPRDKTCGDALSPRALGILQEMGLLEAASLHGMRVDEVRFHAPGHGSSFARIPRAPGLPGHVLMIRRLHLDALLLSKALEAGAEFRKEEVESLDRAGREVRGVRLAGGETVRADLVVLATGAALRLPAAAGLLPRRPFLAAAARRYWEGISGLGPRLEFFFDHVTLPGYGWFFPLGSGQANVGVGCFGDSRGSPVAALQRLLAGHPRLLGLLSGSRAEGEARGHPLRTDFPFCRAGRRGVVAVGEAAGLVNPFSGEGIDNALESARLAGEAVAQARSAKGRLESEGPSRYGHLLRRRFRRTFVVFHVTRRVYYNPAVLDRMFGRGPARQRLVHSLMEICFGAADPLRAIGPSAVLELLRP